MPKSRYNCISIIEVLFPLLLPGVFLEWCCFIMCQRQCWTCIPILRSSRVSVVKCEVIQGLLVGLSSVLSNTNHDMNHGMDMGRKWCGH